MTFSLCVSVLRINLGMSVQNKIEELFSRPAESYRDEYFSAFDEFKAALNEGRIRAAEPSPTGWKVNTWVKRGILLGFRIGRIVEMSLTWQPSESPQEVGRPEENTRPGPDEDAGLKAASTN